VRLRIGVVLWILSWVPYGVILGLDDWKLTLAWTAEILMGVIGLALAGTEFAMIVKKGGWRRAPAAAWRALIHGDTTPKVVTK